MSRPAGWGWDWPNEPREVLPRGLEQIVPGAGLAAVLAGIDRTDLNGYELVTLIEARARVVAWGQAQLLADIAELCHTPMGYVSSDAERTSTVHEESADELRPALHLTRRSAENMARLALDLADRLPQVLSALESGSIDLPRAQVICDGTSHLDDTEARVVADQILVEAGELTTGEIAARLRRLSLRAGPEEGRRRYEAAVADRYVYARPNPEGTGNLYGIDLPADRLAAA
ncbi:MAG TPA: DUF222 domain-containing protein, partial [Acidimicrobiia bacterium]